MITHSLQGMGRVRAVTGAERNSRLETWGCQRLWEQHRKGVTRKSSSL